MYQTPTYVSKLGKRIAAGMGSERDVQELESFCQSFASAYVFVLQEVARLGYESAGRFPKATSSIRAKIIRERTRLSTMQDIAGLRIIVPNIADQNTAIERLREIAPCVIQDRRGKTKGGYRAVHIIFSVEGVPVELQIRTAAQHRWAEVSEKLAENFPELKYGGGPALQRELLDKTSSITAKMEADEPNPPQLARILDVYNDLQEAITMIAKLTREEPPK